MTQAHPFTVDSKQFEAFLAIEETPREPITRLAVQQENRSDNQAQIQPNKNQDASDENIKLELPLPGSFSDQSEIIENEYSCTQSGKHQSTGFYLLFLLALMRIVLERFTRGLLWTSRTIPKID